MKIYQVKMNQTSSLFMWTELASFDAVWKRWECMMRDGGSYFVFLSLDLLTVFLLWLFRIFLSCF